MGAETRVLHAVVNMNRGGAETLIMNLYRRIDRTRVQFDFLTCREGVFDDEIRSLGGKIHRIPWITDAGPVGYVRALDQFFAGDGRRYGIVHAHMDRMSGWVLRAARRAGVPVRIAHSHSTKVEGGALARLYKWASGRLIDPNATDRFACSEAAAVSLFAHRAGEAKLIRNAVDCGALAFDPDVRRAVRAELGLLPGQLAVCHVGRFHPAKNHAFLIDLFAGLTEERPDAVLLLMGDGPLKKDIVRRIEAASLESRVRLLGVRGDIARLLAAMDVMVFPSLHEGLPVALIEAQSAGLPCVVSDRVTEEADLKIGLVTRIPLEAPADRWIRAIKEAAAIADAVHVRREAAEQVRRRGYDIGAVAAELADYYGQAFLRQTSGPTETRRIV
ncbi:Glycogen synthase Starch [bacterial glycogen] synthase [Thermobacillus xylanilyticus]|jgi:glycosyltransferase involved in cell wall biosynthesis|uniref:Glycogen synthase Starch [bacterial glycogen] synthase n=1 Tax=Thermobacillus xylanilyticus TaxID=76633 RepID=A0ABN7RUA7_THEXY|nr:glycosyltransferase family 1 protein [Thermobacillus xylanilyticus]CAG5086042.1 Glycogen synthase Starch [bacterial glycogen] synthase [Thermobacillus xylanilyticus]